METIFQHWPTTRAFARDIGVNFNTAQSWRRRGVLPAKMDLAVIAAAKRNGFPVTLETLASLRATGQHELGQAQENQWN